MSHTPRFVSLALLAALGGCSRAPDSDAFTRKLAERIKQKSPDAEVAVVGPLQVAVTPRNGRRTSLDLSGLWKSCGQKLDCGAPLEQFLASVVSPSLVVEAPVKKEYLRPLLKTTENLTPAEQRLSRPFLAGLAVCYALDAGNARRSVGPGDLQALGLDAAGVEAAALANLGTAPVLHELADGSERVLVVRTGDPYAASALLQPERWQELKGEVKGELIVAAPNQEVLLATGFGEGKPGLDELRRRASGFVEGPGVLTTELLQWSPAGFKLLPR